MFYVKVFCSMRKTGAERQMLMSTAQLLPAVTGIFQSRINVWKL
jgi:hypothetical protein